MICKIKIDDFVSGSCIVAATLPSNVTSFTLDGLDVGTMYSVYVANSENLLSPVLTNITLGFGSNNRTSTEFFTQVFIVPQLFHAQHFILKCIA